MLIDTHAHLQLSHFKTDIDVVIDRARDAGVECIVNVGIDLEGSRRAIELAREHEGLYATAGIHPHNANELNDETVKTLRKLGGEKKVVAIGETGLDYFRNLSPQHVQWKAFQTQMELADELELPVVIHNRDAHSDVIKMVSRFRTLRGIMHCFSGSIDFANQCLRHGFFLSFAGPITYRKSEKLRDVAKRTEFGRILIETDCPWLAPQEVRGKRNEPANLVYIAQQMAQLRGVSLQAITKATTSNARKLLGL